MIVAYEADPAIYRILEQNISINGITNIELHNEAVWSTATSIESASKAPMEGASMQVRIKTS